MVFHIKQCLHVTYFPISDSETRLLQAYSYDRPNLPSDIHSQKGVKLKYAVGSSSFVSFFSPHQRLYLVEMDSFSTHLRLSVDQTDSITICICVFAYKNYGCSATGLTNFDGRMTCDFMSYSTVIFSHIRTMGG